MGKNFASVSSQFRADFWNSGLVSGTKGAGDYKEGEPRTKHEQKIALREKGVTSFHDIAKSTNINAKTAKGYVDVMTEMGKWLKPGFSAKILKHDDSNRLISNTINYLRTDYQDTSSSCFYAFIMTRNAIIPPFEKASSCKFENPG